MKNDQRFPFFLDIELCTRSLSLKSSIGKTLAYGLHLFVQICTSQIAMEIGRTAYALHCAVSL